MVILEEMTKSRPQSSIQILSAAALPRQSKFQEKQAQKGKNLHKNFKTGHFPPRNGPKLRAPSRESLP
jgi:hypothetical protein